MNWTGPSCSRSSPREGQPARLHASGFAVSPSRSRGSNIQTLYGSTVWGSMRACHISSWNGSRGVTWRSGCVAEYSSRARWRHWDCHWHRRQAAHDQGIIHRDLKPSNILLADAPSGSSQAAWPCRGMRLEPKIGDFGLAKLVEYDAKATQSGAAIGTPDYMAPEQTGLIENAQHGPATDIYGLGAILYEMLVGHPPFAGATRHETIRLVVQSEVVSPRRLRSSIPRDLETICLKCLERDPCRRYASAGSLAADLALFLDGRPIRSRRVRRGGRGTLVPAQPTGRRLASRSGPRVPRWICDGNTRMAGPTPRQTSRIGPPALRRRHETPVAVANPGAN